MIHHHGIHRIETCFMKRKRRDTKGKNEDQIAYLREVNMEEKVKRLGIKNVNYLKCVVYP